MRDVTFSVSRGKSHLFERLQKRNNFECFKSLQRNHIFLSSCEKAEWAFLFDFWLFEEVLRGQRNDLTLSKWTPNYCKVPWHQGSEILILLWSSMVPLSSAERSLSSINSLPAWQFYTSFLCKWHKICQMESKLGIYCHVTCNYDVVHIIWF